MLCTIDLADPKLMGHAAELRVVRKVVVRDSRPVNASEVVFRRKIPSLQLRNQFEIHRANFKTFCYSGDKINIEAHSELEIDDGLLFDTTIRQQEEIKLLDKPQVSNDAKGIIEPSDAFDFVKNLAVIPFKNQVITVILALVGCVVIAVNTWVGVHDQFVPEPMVWFYDHHDSDGDGELPLVKSLMGSGVMGTAVWYAMRRQLRKYMTFVLHAVPGRVCRSDTLRASAILRGRSRVPLENIVVRIVACNMEKGQYKRGSGTKERTVSFTEPVRAVVLYEKPLDLVPAGAPVENYLADEIPFEPMFRALYPPQLVGKSHGIALYWEVQLLHDEFIDQELIGPVECFEWKDFLSA